MVLRNGDAPRLTSVAAAATAGTLAQGTWYYKVSAILAATDPDNPGGETLPSDEEILTLQAGDTAIDLAWSPVMVNGQAAAQYRIYRTAAVDGVSQQELLIATVTGTSYTDTGATAGTEAPLPPGALGVWTAQTATHGVRWGHQGAVITDGTGARFFHVLEVAAGVDYHAGPGFVVGGVRVVYSSLDHVLTGDTNAGTLGLDLGYRLVF